MRTKYIDLLSIEIEFICVKKEGWVLTCGANWSYEYENGALWLLSSHFSHSMKR